MLTMAVKAAETAVEMRDISDPITPPRPVSRKLTALVASSCQLTVPSEAKRPASWLGPRLSFSLTLSACRMGASSWRRRETL